MWAGYPSSSAVFTHPGSYSFHPLATTDALDQVNRSLWPQAPAWAEPQQYMCPSRRGKCSPGPKMLTNYKKLL